MTNNKNLRIIANRQGYQLLQVIGKKIAWITSTTIKMGNPAKIIISDTYWFNPSLLDSKKQHTEKRSKIHTQNK